MRKKTDTALERLQRAARSDRPGELERERVADQMLTQDQLRRIDKSLEKITPLTAPRKRKQPPAARPQPQKAGMPSAPDSRQRSSAQVKPWPSERVLSR